MLWTKKIINKKLFWIKFLLFKLDGW
jgi:hypothetical protein